MTGFINVNKVKGVSSAKEVAVVKRLAGVPCGHMGTLDPMASGVLPVAIGNAARLFDYFLDKKKTYRATFLFGADSDTLDTEGTITKIGTVPPKGDIEQVLGEFTGEIMQIPPNYSAKNIAGKRGYELARAGIEFTLPAKKVNIFSILLEDKVSENEYSFIIECGGGTYIRSIARDLGARLGTHAIMSALERTKSGVFDIKNSVQTEELTFENFKNYIIPTDSVIAYEGIYPDEKQSYKLFNGLSVPFDKPDGIYKIYRDGSFYGLAQINQCMLKVRTKLC